MDIDLICALYKCYIKTFFKNNIPKRKLAEPPNNIWSRVKKTQNCPRIKTIQTHKIN